jgi:DNA repair protein RadC
LQSKEPAKRIDIVTLRMVREATILYSPRRLQSPNDAASLARGFLEESDREKFIVICLSTKNEPCCINITSIGSLNSSIVHPREVFKTALLSNAASVILAHNHPSGETTPSHEDIETTNRLVEAGRILGIQVMDHIIIGSENRYLSFKEQALLV